ncbi:MAG: sulfite exporter TauE/SafE family protein, partial [Rhodospirillaceae bacterium]
VVLLGFLLVSYGTISLLGRQLSLTVRQGFWAGPFIGVINGVLTGMTGSFVVPGVMYLQALGLSRDALVQAMGMLFTLSTAALAVALQGQRFLTIDLGLVSAVALFPAMIGMAAGQRLRQRLSEQLFRRIFFWALIVLGMYIIAASGNRMITDLAG